MLRCLIVPGLLGQTPLFNMYLIEGGNLPLDLSILPVFSTTGPKEKPEATKKCRQVGYKDSSGRRIPSGGTYSLLPHLAQVDRESHQK